MRKATGALCVIFSLLALSLCAWGADTAPTSDATPGATVTVADPVPTANDTAEAAADGSSAESNTTMAELLGQPTAQPPADNAPDVPACGCMSASSRGTLEFYGPVSIINQHPPNLLFLSPEPEAAAVLPPGAQRFKLKLDYTNVIIREWDNGTAVDYDYEGLRAGLQYRRGVGRGEAWAELPLYQRGPGWMDGLMASWHSLFGLPNGYRDDFPDNKYRYTIITRDGLAFNDAGDTAGIGDLALGYKYALWNRRAGRDAAALRALAKLPTGSAAQGLGSGGFDFSLGALYQRQLRPHLRAYANADYVFTGGIDWPNIEAQDMLITNWVLEYAASPRTTVLSQYRTNTNPLRTGSKEADKDAQELSFAFNHRIGPNLVWSGGFTEDIAPETAPDFVVASHFNWEF